MTGRVKHRQPLSTRLARAADHVDHIGAVHASRNGLVVSKPAGAPLSPLLREAAELARRFEESDTATYRRRQGLVGVVPSVTWTDGQLFRIVPELEEHNDG